ncbi:LysR family transcriptional regulator [Echinicola vietnamensis]|uniref:Transcriptional regulator n=1 Tax=Echinicola vietnamensis (strain DSM 17526 / LMG 23754 / KMM 6221) TaxID=926556 RepID=L0FXU9_ECHVK|nr:LysR family transcriptional regulator [Echinicola vietnamensis]AGA77475.1 transcriptional regulator [Echinicola vietnamensis DSM 17526]
MFDFRLQVFHTVAKRLNFTKAAEELYISQPAVTKHIRQIELHYQVKLFDRQGSKISLTPAGETLFEHAEQIFAIYRDLEFELNHFTKDHRGELRIGASTTIAQYVLPPILAAFHEKFSDIRLSLSTDNTEQIGKALDQGEIDLGIIEGQTKQSQFKYTEFTKDEILLIARADHPLAKKESLSIPELLKIPLLLREPGSGTLEVIAHALKPLGVKLGQLQKEMQLGSTESIKGYLMNSNAMAFLSVFTVLEELHSKKFTVIDIDQLSIERSFLFIQPHGAKEGIADLFMKFAHRHNFR